MVSSQLFRHFLFVLATKWLTSYATVFPNHRTVISFHHVFDVYTWHCKLITLNCLPNTVIFVIFAVSLFETGCYAFTYMCTMTLLNWIPPLFLIFLTFIILSLQFTLVQIDDYMFWLSTNNYNVNDHTK